MELRGEDDSFMTYEAAGSCSKCQYILPRLVDCAPLYFERGSVTCSHCGEQIDLWEVVSTRAASSTAWGLASMGAAQTWVRMPMETGKYYEVNLTDYGALADAKILAVSYSSQGGVHGSVMPLEWHGNTPARRIRGTILRMIAVPLGESPIPRVGNVGVSVVWIRGGESDAWPYLVSAFEAAAVGDYAPSLVFAQSAVEISMMPVIASRFRQHSSKENVKRFMVDSLSYGHALNVVLPYLCAEVGVAKMPDAIRVALNKLRKTRNLIIHEGVEAAAVSHNEAMEGLGAAAFGFEYMRYVQPILSVAPSRGASAGGLED
jgi:hypothetical protein